VFSDLSAQSDSLFIPAKAITGDIVDFSVDNLSNVYIIYQNGQLKKLNSNGDSLAVFNDSKRYGKIFSIDVSNPLKVLLYYKDFGTILILDRLLNVRATIDLRRQSQFQVKAVGQSYDNNIWIFDELEAKLKKIGDDGRLIDQSTDFRLIFDSVPSPQIIADQNKQIYLYDSLKGVYIFDYYGTFKSRIPFIGWSDFSVINKAIVGRDSSILYKYEPGTLKLEQYSLPPHMWSAKKIRLTHDALYLLHDQFIQLYTFR
jgi:hypothetical protein